MASVRRYGLSGVCTATALTAGVSLTMGLSAAFAREPELPATTPAGITLVEVVRELNASEPKLLWVRPGDAEGRTLLIYDRDSARASHCVAACAREFRPLSAPPTAKARGDWSVVPRSDGGRQWAYQSHPLYTWVKESTPGEVATNVALNETASLKLAENPQRAGSLSPPPGWTVARFTPAASISLPDGMDARLVNAAQAVALVDVKGLTLYTFDGDAKRDGQACAARSCKFRWLPLPAPDLASGVGHFSIVPRADGSRQWAYKGRPLYEYIGDKLPGDAHGTGVDPRWRLAALTQDFRPPHVGVISLNGYGEVLSVNGRTLYGGYPFEKRWGGRNLRDSFAHSAYYKGKRLGPAACTDADCLKVWHPLLASDDAQSNGFWEPIVRPDGGKQWAYKGYALYTYAGDKGRGDHNGQATYDFSEPEGSYAEFKQAVFFATVAKAPGGAGIYWNIAHP